MARWPRTSTVQGAIQAAVLVLATATGPGVAGATSQTGAETEPRITAVHPEMSDGLLVCRLATEGLPGPRILSTLSSGLESAVEIHLELIDEGDDPATGRRYDLRLSFDLWEEAYSASIGPQEARFADLDGLRNYLAELPPLAVARVSDLDPDRRYRLTAGLRLHPLAPSARGRMQEMVSGGDPAGRNSGDAGQEVSISLGRLIRFFYRGGSPRGDLVGALQSGPFTTRELNDVSH